jgi:hypothetical protein
VLRRAPDRNTRVQVFGGRGAGKTRGAASLAEHQVIVEADHSRVWSLGSSQPHVVSGMYRAKCGCGWRDEFSSQGDAHVGVQRHLDGVTTDVIADAIEGFEPEPPRLTGRELEDARVRQGTIEILLEGDGLDLCPHGNEIHLGAFPSCCDWRCECGDLNRRQEAFCYRCGAGPPEMA